MNNINQKTQEQSWKIVSVNKEKQQSCKAISVDKEKQQSCEIFVENQTLLQS